MRRTHLHRLSAVVLAGLAFALSPGCAPAKPTVIAVMRNPATGQQVEMYRENPLKVPDGYNEATHIVEWKAEQRARGYTEDRPVP